MCHRTFYFLPLFRDALYPGGYNFDLSEKNDQNSFVIIFDELSNTFSVFLYDQ